MSLPTSAGQDKVKIRTGRDLPHQLLSWAKQTQVGETSLLPSKSEIKSNLKTPSLHPEKLLKTAKTDVEKYFLLNIEYQKKIWLCILMTYGLNWLLNYIDLTSLGITADIIFL